WQGAGTGERVERRVVEIEAEELRPRRCLVIQSREPAREMKVTAPRSPLAEPREPDLPQLDVRRLGEGHAVARVLSRRIREVGEGRERGRHQRRVDPSRELRRGEYVDAGVA